MFSESKGVLCRISSTIPSLTRSSLSQRAVCDQWDMACRQSTGECDFVGRLTITFFFSNKTKKVLKSNKENSSICAFALFLKASFKCYLVSLGKVRAKYYVWLLSVQ